VKKSASTEKGKLAERVRAALKGRKGVTERNMFGGTCFLLREHMLCGTGKPGFMFRVGKERGGAALRRKGASPMEFNGRRFEGFVWVDPDACNARNLKSWIALAESYVAKLPPKKRK